IEDVIGIDTASAIYISAKTGVGIEDVLEGIVRHLPSPGGSRDAPLKALIIDSWFDNYQGTVSLVRVFDGRIDERTRIRMMSTGREYQVEQLGRFTPKQTRSGTLQAGEVGYLIAGIKDIKAARVGDTVTTAKDPAEVPLTGFKKVKPQVFAGLYPVNNADFEALRDALDKLSLNDASLEYQPEVSDALGFGFRCGFLGMLHMEIVQERLEREYELELITTAPTVVYEVELTDGSVIEIDNPARLPEPARIAEIREPYIHAQVLT